MVSGFQLIEHDEMGLGRMYQVSKTITLIGLMGAGKTAVGSIIAERLGVAFLDSDHEIEKAAKMTIKEIFERDGEGFFRQKETQVIERLLAGDPAVLSTGGGAFIRAENRQAIDRAGFSVWLKADLDLLWDRVKSKDTRPLLMGGDGYQVLKKLHQDRSDIYEMANLTVEAEPDLSKEGMAAKVIKALEEAPNSGLTRRN